MPWKYQGHDGKMIFFLMEGFYADWHGHHRILDIPHAMLPLRPAMEYSETCL